MPRLTCITTLFNEGPLLRRSVESVLGQSFRDFQFIIVDDGADASTVNALEDLEDPRILLIRQSNAGLSEARNAALEQVTGEHICFLDADDSRPDWAFEAIVDQLEHDDPDVLFCRGAACDARGAPAPFYDNPHFDRIASLLPGGIAERADPVAAQIWPVTQLIEPQSANKVVRAALLQHYGIGFPSGYFFEDILFHTHVLAAAQRIAFTDFPCFAYFRRHGRAQITAGADARRLDIIPVSKMVLESPARQRWMHDPLYRSAVFCACMKLLEWCENSITLAHRPGFRLAVSAMMRLIDPAYREFARDDLLALGLPLKGVDYAVEMLDA